MIKNIVFDFGGVIVDYNPEQIIRNYTDDDIEVAKLKKELFDSPFWEMFDAGAITQEQLQKNVEANVYAHQRELVGQIIDSWYLHLPEYPVEKLIHRLKAKGYAIYLLSNASIQFELYQNNIAILKEFDGIYVSGFHRLLKPSYFIYQDFLKTFDLQGEECLFIDDVEANVQGALNIKMAGIVHDGDVANLENKLKKIGVL